MKKLLILSLFTLSSSFFTHCEAQYTNLLNFAGASNGANPDGSLVISGHVLYGMTSSGGANTFGCIFSINTNGSGYSDMHDFNLTDGAYPDGSLTLSGTVLYGMTNGGGANGFGCIFSINTNGTGYTDLWDFDDTGSNGATPFGTLTLSGTVLYGMTWGGGRNADGNIFSINTNGTGYTDILDFNGTNGLNPMGDLTLSGGVLYGMTWGGGINGDGNIFSINTNGTGYVDLFDFSASTGNNPAGDLILAGNVLYGMTESGGTYTDGNIFSITTAGTRYTDLLDFNSINGYGPYGSLILSGKILYGLTTDGGTRSDGNMISIDTTGTAYVDMFNFSGTNGQYPYGSLLLSTGVFYGMTQSGGANNDGVIFSFSPCTFTATTSVVSNVSCNGDHNGSASATPTGGKSPYTYVWTNGGTSAISTTNPTGTILSAGSYMVTITDSNSCTSTATVNITQPSAIISIMGTPTNATCSANNGSVRVTAGGGTTPYTYNWSPNGGTTSTGSNLSGGTYTVTITDKNGCTKTASAVITQPTLLSYTDSIANVSCNGGDNGSITVLINSGIPPYTYSWNTGNTTSSLTGLMPGTYSVTVKDSTGCTVNSTVNIMQPMMPLNVNAFTNANATCYGVANGSAFSFANGGTMPYIYSWSPGGNNNPNPNLSGGTYTLTVTDNNGCTGTASIIITQPPAFVVSIDSTIPAGGCNGTAAVIVSGATPPYTYLWSGGQTTDTIYNQCAGVYCCTITDNIGCTDTICVSIITGINELSVTSSQWSVYPNPTNGKFTIESVGTQNFVSGNWAVEVYNVLGEKVYSQFNIQHSTFSIDISDKADGVYLVRIQNEDGSSAIQKKIVKMQ